MRICLAAFTLFLLMGSVKAADDEYPVTLEQARKWSLELDIYDRYDSEFGDPKGPFKPVGGARFTTTLHNRIHVRQNKDDLHLGSLNGFVLTRVEYFINAQGNAFAVVFKSPRNPGAFVEDDHRDYDHIRLCPPAEIAIEQGNTRLMESLLEAGLEIDEIVDADAGQNALQSSASSNQPAMVKFLLGKGARRDLRDLSGKRAIDLAFREEHQEICELLRQPDPPDPKFEGISSGAVEEVMRQLRSEPDPQLSFLSVNEADPSLAWMERLAKIFPNSHPRSQAEESDSAYVDKKTKKPGQIVELRINEAKPGEYTWRLRRATGSFLSGGGISGRVTKAYGYWIVHDVSGWDE